MSTAFLHASTDREHVFAEIPVEARGGGGCRSVWRLKRALYGLCMAPRLWQDHLTKVPAGRFSIHQ